MTNALCFSIHQVHRTAITCNYMFHLGSNFDDAISIRNVKLFYKQ